MTKTRFAPNPNGLIHIGNARIAIIAYLFTKKNRGKYILRIDDTENKGDREIFIKSID